MAVKTIDIGSFALCTGLTNINIPQSVTEIKDWAFDSCSGLTSLVVPSSVSSIGYQAFQGCTGLKEVTIGNNVTAIGSKAFDQCNALQSVTCEGNVPPTIENGNCFTWTCYVHATLKVPNEALTSYKSADCWKRFVNIQEMGGVTHGDMDSDGKINITDVTLLIDLLLGSEPADVHQPLAGDTDLDGKVNITDVTILIDQLLNSTN